MQLGNTEVVDSFAEAFKMWAGRVVITADSARWALAAARSMTGFATSVIGCKCEAGIDQEVPSNDTPDGRPGVAVLLFAFDAEGVGKRLIERVGQCVMTCPTTSCFNGLVGEKTVSVGGKLRFFGDGFQISKRLAGRHYWRIPVMDGEFLVEDRFGVQPAVGGGNLIILGKDRTAAVTAAEAAAKAMGQVPGVILPFPGGIVRSGSKVGSKYKALMASTNDAYCPSLRAMTAHSAVPEGVGAVMEIVVDGLSLSAVEESMRRGLDAAASAGADQVTAGNYGGKLGQYHIRLKNIL